MSNHKKPFELIKNFSMEAREFLTPLIWAYPKLRIPEEHNSILRWPNGVTVVLNKQRDFFKNGDLVPSPLCIREKVELIEGRSHV